MKNLIITITIIILNSCTTTRLLNLPSAIEKAPLSGTIYDEQGLPVSKVKVSINKNRSTVTDINGNFLFDNLTFGEHTLHCKKNGFISKEINFNYKFFNKNNIKMRIKITNTLEIFSKIASAYKSQNFDNMNYYLKRYEKDFENNEIYLYSTALIAIHNDDYKTADKMIDRILNDYTVKPEYLATMISIKDKLNDKKGGHYYKNLMSNDFPSFKLSDIPTEVDGLILSEN